MSDKHTDAQPCPFCGTAIEVAYEQFGRGAGLIYVTCDCGATGAGGKTQAEAIDAWNKRYVSPGRATEGQAQTSALGIDLSKLPVHHIEGLENGGYYLCTDVIRAAQLADSTAPGAPELHSLTDEDFKNPVLCRAYLEGSIESFNAAMAEVARLRALLAAPTAQQSLTAGGAVPEIKTWAVREKEFEARFPDSGVGYTKYMQDEINDLRAALAQKTAPVHNALLADITKALKLADKVGRSRQDNGYAINSTAVDALVTLQMSIEDRIKALAAAPLPQVQSEALIVRVIDKLIAEGTLDWKPVGQDYEDSDDGGFNSHAEEIGAITEHVRAALIADQQPVTPSGEKE